MAGAVEAHREALQRPDRGALEGDLQVVNEGGVGPAPGDFGAHLGEQCQQDQPHRQQQPAGKAAVGGQYLVEQKPPRQQRRHDRRARARGQRHGDHRHPPVLARRHHGEQPRQHAPAGRRRLLLHQPRRRLGRRRCFPLQRARRPASQHAIGRLRELLRRGQPRTRVARQQPDAPVALRDEAAAAQVAMRGQAVDLAPCQQRHAAVTDQRHAGRPCRQPIGRQPPVRADVRGEGSNRLEVRVSPQQQRDDVRGQGHEARNL